MNVQARWQSSFLHLWCAPDCDIAGLRQFIATVTGDELLASAAQVAGDSASLKLSPAEGFDLLIAVSGKEPREFSDSLRFWARLARLVKVGFVVDVRP